MTGKVLPVLIVVSMAFAASAELPSVMPIPSMSGEESVWMRRHREKLAQAAAGRSFDVVFVGDSIIEYWERQCPRSWARWLTDGLKVLNLGFAGDHTEHVMWRIAEGELDGYSAKSIVLMIGVNNANTAMRREVPADIVVGVRAVLDAIRAKQPQAHVVLCAILPCEIGTDGRVRRDCEVVNREIRKFCDNRRVVWCDLSQMFMTADGRLSRRLLPDLLHPSAEGYDLIASALMPYLRRFLKPDEDALPFPQLLPTQVPAREWADLPVEAIPCSEVDACDGRLDKGPYGDLWWLNRLRKNRERIVNLACGEVDVVLLGDSAFHLWEAQQGEAWRRFAARRSTLNLGYAGDRTQNVLWRVENGELDGYRAKAVVLTVGAANSMRGSKPEDTALGVRTVIGAIRRKQPTARVVLCPVFSEGSDAQVRRNDETVNAIVRNYANGVSVLWCACGEGMTASDAGWNRLADELEPVLERICN